MSQEKHDPEGTRLFTIKIQLDGCPVKVIRTVTVSSLIPLSRLHTVIQRAMGWESYHLYDFHMTKRSAPLSKSLPLDWALDQPRNTMYYTYDMGDNWVHKITLMKDLPPDPAFVCPICLSGQGACPPEDSGGIYGYAWKLKALQDPTHEDYEGICEWMGGADFDPEAFDLEEVNLKLKRLKP